MQRAEEPGFTHAWFYDTQMLCADVFVAMAERALTGFAPWRFGILLALVLREGHGRPGLVALQLLNLRAQPGVLCDQ